MRKHTWSRALITENRLHPENLILPVFIHDASKSEPIPSMPGVMRLCINDFLYTCETAVRAGVPAIAIFPVVTADKKDATGSHALEDSSIVIQALQAAKTRQLPLGYITDIALDPYTTHGHDGILQEDGTVDNDRTIQQLAQQAVVHAQAGADIVAPSDMQDGRIGTIRKALDRNKFLETSILAYTAKYASSFYGPFREAIGANPLKESGKKIATDKKHYQMNIANRQEAIHAAEQNLAEGADCLMVKPSMPYLDIIQTISQHTQAPVFAYQVSGEYSMIKLLAQSTQQDSITLLHESLLSCKRAGAQAILSYAATEIAQALQAGIV